MVKRKADISIDEWLTIGLDSLESGPVNGVESQKTSNVEPRPTVTISPLGGRTEPTTETTVDIVASITNMDGNSADVAGTNAGVAGTGVPLVESTEEAAEWFWRLLEQSTTKGGNRQRL